MPGTEKTQHISLTTQVENRLKHQLSIGALKPGKWRYGENSFGQPRIPL